MRRHISATILSASCTHLVPFHDIDLLQIVWHGHYMKYFEMARTALGQKLGCDWPTVKEWGFQMPVVEVSARYLKAIPYNQQLVLVALCQEPMLPALELKYEILSADHSTTFATGRSRQVYIETGTGELQYALPDVFAACFRSALSLRGAD